MPDKLAIDQTTARTHRILRRGDLRYSRRRMVRWLYYRAWLSTEPSSVLFDLATARLVERQVLLRGVTILARLGPHS